MEARITGQVNDGGICSRCRECKIEWGILRGSHWYYCHNCKSFIKGWEVNIKEGVK